MAFISASLLAELPLISLFDEPDQPFSTPPTMGVSSGLTTGTHITSNQANDLMDFEDRSPADRLYAAIYQKHLQKFLATSRLTLGKKAIGGDIKPTKTAIPSLIDELITEINFDSNFPAEYEQTLIQTVDSKEMICVSNDIAKSPLNGSENELSLNGTTSSELEEFQFIHAISVTTSGTIKSLGKDEKLNETNGSTSPVSDVVTSDYLAGESSLSEDDIKPTKRASLITPIHSTTRCPVFRNPASYNRRLVRINLPYDILHTMQEDCRFDGVCHAWVRRPDFCKFGVNCDYIHDYPPVLAEQYGIIAVQIGPDGKEIRGAEEFLKLEDVLNKTNRTNMDDGAKRYSPGCYKENCRAFLKNECTHGDKCWYRHPKTIIEGGKQVTKDIRRMVGNRRCTYDDPAKTEKVDTSDRFWGGRQSSISPTGSFPSDTGSSGDRPLRKRASRVDFASKNSIHEAASKAPAPKPSHFFISSDECNEAEVDSSAEEVYYPGLANAARIAAKMASAKSTLIKVSSKSPPARDHTSPADFKSTTCKHVVVNTESTPTPIESEAEYNYWGEVVSVNDAADYWGTPTPPVTVSRMDSRQQAIIVEAVTYNGLFGDESHAEPRQGYKPREEFVLPPQPAETHRESQIKKLFDAKLDLAQAKQDKEIEERKLIDVLKVQQEERFIDVSKDEQEKGFINVSEAMQEKVKVNETLIDLFTTPELTRDARTSGARTSTASCSIFDTLLVKNGGYDNGAESPGSDWAKSLKAMLAQKCEPIEWSVFRAETNLDTLIEF